MKKIFYNGNEAYQVVRKLPHDTFNPKKYGVNRDDEKAFMMILQLWRDEHHCDHVLRQGNDFLLCRSIKNAKIIE